MRPWIRKTTRRFFDDDRAVRKTVWRAQVKIGTQPGDIGLFEIPVPAGNYTMRLEAQWEKWNQATPPQFTIKVEQGVAHGFNFFFLLIALAIPPIIVAFRHFSFERRRWADSSFNPYASSGGGDDDDE